MDLFFHSCLGLSARACHGCPHTSDHFLSHYKPALFSPPGWPVPEMVLFPTLPTPRFRMEVPRDRSLPHPLHYWVVCGGRATNVGSMNDYRLYTFTHGSGSAGARTQWGLVPRKAGPHRAWWFPGWTGRTVGPPDPGTLRIQGGPAWAGFWEMSAQGTCGERNGIFHLSLLFCPKDNVKRQKVLQETPASWDSKAQERVSKTTP